MFGFAAPSALRKVGIVGMNGRNVSLIAPNNDRKFYPLVDDKLQTKLICKDAGLPTPQLIGVCSFQHQVPKLPDFLKDDQAFVIKPAKGSGGRGILVITGREGKNFIKPSGAIVTPSQLKRHVSNTLSGLFSLGGKPDVAVIESLVDFDDTFEGYSFEGVPDVRVIVYKGYPVMAMTRLSTRASDGKANLHQGAVGVGIDIATGKALKAVQFGRPIDVHPDTQKPLFDLQIPHWNQVLAMASQGYEMTSLGYLGADIVLDRLRGPLILELNARPGLAIQVANQKGLQPRIDFVEAKVKQEKVSWGARVQVAKESIASL